MQHYRRRKATPKYPKYPSSKNFKALLLFASLLQFLEPEINMAPLTWVDTTAGVRYAKADNTDISEPTMV